LGGVIFRESFKRYKIIGLFLALISILIIGFAS
jgi:multidrug transporter EmrE-like cation transporter